MQIPAPIEISPIEIKSVLVNFSLRTTTLSNKLKTIANGAAELRVIISAKARLTIIRDERFNTRKSTFK